MDTSKSLKIVGGGPVGLSLAIGLSKRGYLVTLYEPNSKKDLLKNNRVVALNHSTKKLFSILGIWNKIKLNSTSFNKLNVYDLVSGSNMYFTKEDLGKDYRSEHTLGWIVELSDLIKIMRNEILHIENINIMHQKFKPENISKRDLIFAADGYNSSVAKILGLKSLNFNFNQVCLTFNASLRGIRSDESYELFTNNGPLAILPKGNSIFQIIWTTSKNKYYRLIEKSSDSFILDYLACTIPEHIEVEMLTSEIKYYPLKYKLISKLVKNRTFFLGEAAHCIHPVAGQGINLSFRDVYTIYNLFDRKGNPPLRTRLVGYKYILNRYTDNILISCITTFLVLFYSNRSRFIHVPKRLSFIMLRKIKPLRKFIFSLMSSGI